MGTARCGERRKTVRQVTVRVPVSITLDWPEGIDFDEETAKEVAASMIPQTDEVDVGPTGKIVWCRRWAEVDFEEVEIE